MCHAWNYLINMNKIIISNRENYAINADWIKCSNLGALLAVKKLITVYVADGLWCNSLNNHV